MVLDLGLLERSMEEVRKTLDHKLLNKVEALGTPTLENISRYIWERVQHAGKITRVSVHRDSCNESCTYFGPQGKLTVIARSEATKQSILSFCGTMDCFASLAMTEHVGS